MGKKYSSMLLIWGNTFKRNKFTNTQSIIFVFKKTKWFLVTQ